MDGLGIKVEESLRDHVLPKSFGLAVDGWTCAREHYFAIFAVWTATQGGVQKALLCCGVQDEIDVDDDVAMDFSAESLGDYILDELNLVGHDFESIEFISGDNTHTNPKLARLIGLKIAKVVPLIGCAS